MPFAWNSAEASSSIATVPAPPSGMTAESAPKAGTSLSMTYWQIWKRSDHPNRVQVGEVQHAASAS
jgi:hypothetical protein